MGMRIKHLVMNMMADSFPEFSFFGSPRFFYVFRRKSPRGLFDYIKYQRDIVIFSAGNGKLLANAIIS